jgi:cell division protein FtsA
MLDKFKDLSKTVVNRATDVASQAANKAGAATSKLKSDEGDQHVVALDIGTEFVKALVARIGADGSIEIIGVGREHQKLSDMQAGAISDIASVVQNCDKALNTAEQQAGVSVRTAIIGIAGELVKGTTTTVRVARKNPSKQLDIDEMERIIQLVQARAETRAKQQVSIELGSKDVELRLVNSALVNIEIDGYPVTNPIGFQGKDVVVQLYTAFAPMIHIGALERTAQELDLDLLAVAAEPFAVARSVIGDSQSANLNVILMDVGGGTTDIAVINDGGVQGTKMFGIGGRAYTRAVEREVGVEFDQAEKLKIAYGSGKMPAAREKAVGTALEKTVKVWTDGVELALSDFDKLDHLPHRLYLCGGGSSLQMLMDQLAQSEWYKALPFTRKPVVHHVRPEQVVGITDSTGDVNDHTFITAMGLLRVGMDTMQFTGGGKETVRDKIDKMLRV